MKSVSPQTETPPDTDVPAAIPDWLKGTTERITSEAAPIAPFEEPKEEKVTPAEEIPTEETLFFEEPKKEEVPEEIALPEETKEPVSPFGEPKEELADEPEVIEPETEEPEISPKDEDLDALTSLAAATAAEPEAKMPAAPEKKDELPDWLKDMSFSTASPKEETKEEAPKRKPAPKKEEAPSEPETPQSGTPSAPNTNDIPDWLK